MLYSDQYAPQVIAGKGWGVDSPLEGSQSPKFIHDRTGRINYDYIIRSKSAESLHPRGRPLQQSDATGLAVPRVGPEAGTSKGSSGIRAPFRWSISAAVRQLRRDLADRIFPRMRTARVTFTENLTWVKGRHSMKFGGNYWPEYANAREGGGSSGNSLSATSSRASRMHRNTLPGAVHSRAFCWVECLPPAFSSRMPPAQGFVPWPCLPRTSGASPSG